MQTTEKENNNRGKQLQAGSINITYYTDPLCCWSWIFEREWQQLLTAFKDDISYHYCMGGLLPSWNNYHDAINNVSKPLQMGPLWMHAAEISGLKIRHDIWAKDPPASSYPACIAVKCAQLQSEQAGEKYLFLLREACMMEGKNIAEAAVLFELADKLADCENFKFDTKIFQQHLFGDEGREAFKKDLQEVKYRGINRFPSLLITNANRAKLITGYQTFDALAPVFTDLISQSHQTNY